MATGKSGFNHTKTTSFCRDLHLIGYRFSPNPSGNRLPPGRGIALAISPLEAEEVDPPMVEELSNRRMGLSEPV